MPIQPEHRVHIPNALVFLLTASVFEVMEEVNITNINVILNPFCRQNALYTVQVFFGVRQKNSNDTCHPQQNMMTPIVPGKPVIISVNTTALEPKENQEYCYTNISLTGEPATCTCMHGNVLYEVYVLSHSTVVLCI